MGKNRKTKFKKNADAIEKDERFAVNRPRFRASPSFLKHTVKIDQGGRTSFDQGNKIVLDERFSSVLTDSRFQLEERDKYGRKPQRKDKKSAKSNNSEMEVFYRVDDDNEEKDEGNDDPSTAGNSMSDSREEQNDTNKTHDNNNDQMDPASRISYLTALSRGELEVSSSSFFDDDDDSDDSSEEDGQSTSSLLEDPVHGAAEILDPSTKLKEDTIEFTHEASPHLAVTNLDWTHVRAVDIYAILSSFSPPGSLQRVQVFLSDYGKAKLKQEMELGPGMLWKKSTKTKKNSGTNTNEDESTAQADESDDSSSATKSNDPNSLDGLRDGKEQKILETYEDFIQATKEQKQQQQESDFDPEKLRAYEASKLKYYFAVAEFVNAKSAEIAYNEVDGMEFEHSSAAVDMRFIPKDAIDDIVKARELRDEAMSLPGNYVPPAFIVTALQQTNVQCTWEEGDTQRERLLTKYSSPEQWAAYAEEDDLRAYLASDNSSTDNDDGDDDDSDESDTPKAKGANLRKLLGLDSGSEDEGGPAAAATTTGTAGSSEDDADSDEDNDREISKEIMYDPGKTNLQEKIKAKLQAKESSQKEELTPWEKYKQKQREKRKEKREAVRRKRSDIMPQTVGASATRRSRKDDKERDDDDEENSRKKLSNAELELLLAGENDGEAEKDFDMRRLQRIDKNKDKRLRGSRKRKQEKLAADVSGKDFEIDLKDSRFAAVLDGSDGLFGIDRTDPQYKETPAMREILEEQKARRTKRRTKPTAPTPNHKVVPPDVVAGSSNMNSSGSAALSSLVKSLKTKVANA